MKKINYVNDIQVSVGSAPPQPLALVVVNEVVLILYTASHFTQLTNHTLVVVFPACTTDTIYSLVYPNRSR